MGAIASVKKNERLEVKDRKALGGESFNLRCKWWEGTSMRVPGGPREESSIPEKEREDSQGQAKFRMIGKEKKKFKKKKEKRKKEELCNR